MVAMADLNRNALADTPWPTRHGTGEAIFFPYGTMGAIPDWRIGSIRFHESISLPTVPKPFVYHIEPQRQPATSGPLFLSHIVGQTTGETFEGGCKHTHVTPHHNTKLFASATMELRNTS